MSIFRVGTYQDFGGRWCLNFHCLALRNVASTLCLHVQKRTIRHTIRCHKPEYRNLIFRAPKPSNLTSTATRTQWQCYTELTSFGNPQRPVRILKRGGGTGAALCRQMFAFNWGLRPCVVATVRLSRTGKPYRLARTYPTTGWPQLASPADSPSTCGRSFLNRTNVNSYCHTCI